MTPKKNPKRRGGKRYRHKLKREKSWRASGYKVRKRRCENDIPLYSDEY